MLSILLLVIGAVIAYWIQFKDCPLHSRRREQFRYFEHLGIPYVKPDSFILGDTEWINAPHHAQMRNVERFGRCYGWFISGANPLITIADRRLLDEILVERFSSFRDLPFFIFGGSCARDLLTIRGAEWHRCRAALSPSFSTLKLKQLKPIMDTAVDDLMGLVAGAVDGGESIEFLRLFQLYTMQIMGEAMFAFKCNALTDPDGDEFTQKFSKILAAFGNWRALASIFLTPWLYRLTGSGGMPSFQCPQPHLTNELFKQIRRIVRERRRIQAEGGKTSAKSVDYLSLMLEAADGGRISDEEIEWNAYIFLLAGYETTASTLAATVYCLAMHPDVQERLHGELDDDFDRMMKLPLLENIIHEAGRLFGPSTMAARECIETTALSNGMTIPKGANIDIPLYYLAHDPSAYAEPMQFRPDRWDGRDTSQWLDMPFGRGPRQCIGQRFAKFEMKLALVRLVRHYRLGVDPKGRTDPDGLELVNRFSLLQAKNGVWLRAERR